MSKEDKKALGQLIKRERERHFLTQEELAALLGVTDMTIYRWESGKSKPHLYAQRKLMKILELQKDAFSPSTTLQTISGSSSPAFTQKSAPVGHISPHELAKYVKSISSTMIFRGWRKTERGENGLVDMTYVTLNEYPLPFGKTSRNDVRSRFDWGYEGFAANLLTASVLAAYFTIYQYEPATQYDKQMDVEFDFAKEVVASLPHEAWELSSEQIQEWLKQRKGRKNTF